MSKAFLSTTLACVLAAVSVGCSREPDVEQVPVGTEVQLTRKDGGVVAGKLEAKDAEQVKVDTGRVTRTVARKEVADVKIIEPGKPVVLPAMAKFREFTVPAGTTLHLDVKNTLSSDTNHEGDPIEATLSSPVVVDDVEVLPAGSVVRGVISNATPAGKVKGVASLGLQFTSVAAHDERYQISAGWAAEADSKKGQDVAKIGIGAGVGAAIGGILGGGKGAATGAAIGGGAGTALVLTTKGKPVVVSAGANITAKLANNVDVKVPVKADAR